MTQVAEKVLYTAKVHTTGGRDGGASRSDDGRLDIKHSVLNTGLAPILNSFSPPGGLHVRRRDGLAARKIKIKIPADMAIDAEVDLCLVDGAYFLQARLNVSLPGLEREAAQALTDLAHQTCPYSKAIRGNVDVAITWSKADGPSLHGMDERH